MQSTVSVVEAVLGMGQEDHAMGAPCGVEGGREHAGVPCADEAVCLTMHQQRGGAVVAAIAGIV